MSLLEFSRHAYDMHAVRLVAKGRKDVYLCSSPLSLG